MTTELIHVNVRRARSSSGFVVEVSIGGGPFVEHWFLPRRGANDLEARLAAETDGRIYAAGIKFGGGNVRMTAFGEDVYVPAMDTISMRQHEAS